MKQKTAMVAGAGGFIGHHLVNRLKDEGYVVHGYDLKHPEFGETRADEFFIFDLRQQFYNLKYDEVYQLAADMGGAGYIFTGEHDADVMHNSAQINLNTCDALKGTKTKIFYSSSACIYPAYNQIDPNSPNCRESTCYPAAPDSEYGWEKLFSERLYMSHARNYGLDVKIARFHNIFGHGGTWQGGREKAPAAICRKVALAKDGESISIWGDGSQVRSFLFIDECLEGVERLMRSDCREPINIGSDEAVSINQLAEMVINISGKKLTIEHDLTKPQGVRGRNSNNEMIFEKLGWKPSSRLYDGLKLTYEWINKQVHGRI